MKAEYIEDLGKNYLMLSAGQTENEFAVRMLSENKIQGLLVFEKRMFNGEALHFYDVSGKQALSAGLKETLFSGEEMRCLFRSLYCLAEDLRLYFLEMKGVILDFNMIFRDAKSYYFCYDPSAESVFGNTLEHFAEELPGYIDHEDEEAVMLGYSFYKLVRAGDKAFIQILEEVLSESCEKSPWQEDCFEEQEENIGEITEKPEESLNRTKNIKFRNPDIWSLVFFAGALLVSLCYLAECCFLTGGLIFDFLKKGPGIAAFLIAFLSIPGMAAAFVDIDIKAKK